MNVEQSGGTVNIDENLRIGFRNDVNPLNNVARLGDGTYKITGGELTVDGWCTLSFSTTPGIGKMIVKGGAAHTITIGSLYIGAYAHTGVGTASGTLQIGDDQDQTNGQVDATITLDDLIQYGTSGKTASLWFGPASYLDVQEPSTTASTCTFILTDDAGSVVIDTNAVSDDLAGLGATTIKFVTEDAGYTKKIEVAGLDDGLPGSGDFDPDDDNFVLGKLVVGQQGASATYGPVTLELVDGKNNIANEGEALYTKTLEMQPGGAFELDSAKIPFSLYYLNSGDPKKLYAGDADLDGDVDFGDYQILQGNFGETEGMNWEDADFDGDRDVDFADYQISEANYGSGGGDRGEPLPELKDYDGDGDVDIDDLHILQEMTE